jgi:hypothetical protein
MSFYDDEIIPENHNKTWTSTDLDWLKQLWGTRFSILAISDKLKRTELAIVIKLKNLNLNHTRHLDGTNKSTWYNPHATSNPTTTKEIIMTTAVDPNREDIIAGNNMFKSITAHEKAIDTIKSKLTSEHFFNEIKAKELEIERLNSIKAKPKAIVEQIDKLQEEIKALVKWCDSL